MVQDASAHIEYTIYTYDVPVDKKSGLARWRLYATTVDMLDAIKKARSLYETSQYHRVEVKKKFFDERKGRMIDAPFKRFEHAPSRNVGIYLYLAGAAMAGIIAFVCANVIMQ